MATYKLFLATRTFFFCVCLCVCVPSGHWDSGLASGFSQVPVAMPTSNWSPRMSNDVMWLCFKVPTKTLLPLQHLITHYCCQVLLILTCLLWGFLPGRCVSVSVCAVSVCDCNLQVSMFEVNADESWWTKSLFWVLLCRKFVKSKQLFGWYSLLYFLCV